jgi:hypothetical protein
VTLNLPCPPPVAPDVPPVGAAFCHGVEKATLLSRVRRLLPLGLITYGSSPYDSWAPDGSKQSSVPGCSNGESGLDNGPTTEGQRCVNQSGQYLQNQYSAGQTGLYLMDTKALIAMAQMIGRGGRGKLLSEVPNFLGTRLNATGKLPACASENTLI